MLSEDRPAKQGTKPLLFWLMCVVNVFMVAWLWTNLPPACPKGFVVALVCMSISVIGTMVSRITQCWLWWSDLARWHAILLILMFLLL